MLSFVQSNTFFPYKLAYSLDTRTSECRNIRTRYPQTIPVICEPGPNSVRNFNAKTLRKYIVPKNITVGQFVGIIRRQMKMPANNAMFLCVGETMLPTGYTIHAVHESYQAQDGFLYINYTMENTFG